MSQQTGFENIDTFNPQDTFGRNRSEDNPRTQTRIRLLQSFQQSYLEDGRSASNPVYTQPEETHAFTGYNNAENSRTFPRQQPKLESQSHNNYWVQQFKGGKTQKSEEKRQFQFEDQSGKRAKLLQKIQILQRNIEEERYNDNIQDKLFEFLSAKISNRNNKAQKPKDHEKIVEKAIDFMDSGYEFMMEYSKLKKIYKK